MKDMFPGYVCPFDDDFAKAFSGEAIISFDTNIILNLYRYSRKKAEEFLATLAKLQDRLWLTHQAGLEIMRNRVEVINEQGKTYSNLKKYYRESIASFKGKFGRHPLIPVDKYIERMEQLANDIDKEVNELESKHTDTTFDDPILNELHKLFNGRIGDEPSDADLKAKISMCVERFKKEKEIPPGYKDRGKQGDDKYGDAIIWLQLIDHAKLQKKTVIFVTDDTKEDWWQVVDGRTIGPRPELAQEMFKKAGVKCFIFRTEPFLKQVAKHLNQDEPKELIKEVREVENRSSASEIIRLATADLSPRIQEAEAHYAALMQQHESLSYYAHISKMRGDPNYNENTAQESIARSLEQVEAARRSLQLLKSRKALIENYLYREARVYDATDSRPEHVDDEMQHIIDQLAKFCPPRP
jgi:hypothetical protein